MDSGEDFFTPEFLNIVFFQQKNLVIFPYVDLKHLHALEIFTAGYTVVDLESTVLHDLKNILEFESSNSYSQSPSLYFIYNLDKPKIQEIMSLEGVRCILNSNENITELVNGTDFIFYNKKSGTFLNFPETSTDLEFERLLISSATSTTILQDSIQSIKNTSSKIFEQVNHNNSPEKIAIHLKDYNATYWQKILDFTSQYYQVELPNASELLKYSSDASSVKSREKDLHDFSDEYELIVSKNKALGKEFIQLIHDYRSAKVNASHLQLEELYSPLKLYNYLRNRHWKEGIPETFIKNWSEMKLSSYELSEEDIVDFEDICSTLGISRDIVEFSTPEPISVNTKPKLADELFMRNEKPSLHKNWKEYKRWLLDRLDSLSRVIDKAIKNQIFIQNKELYSYLLQEISRLNQLVTPPKLPQTHQLGDRVRKEIDTNLEQVRIKEWVDLFGIQDKYRMVSIFRKYVERLYNDIFGRDQFNEKIVPKIKALVTYFHLSTKMESNLLWLNNFRNKLTHDDRYSDSEVDVMLGINIKKINNIIMRFITGLITSQLNSLIKNNRNLSDNIYAYIRDSYFDAEYISTLPLNLLYEKMLVL
ncbi:MAG: hypothetical protein KGD58_14850 [Candidatus Lokiarchaeota archaeon]|nr:hypothetical protein [Candidatus Lokiarchaeota archaeon]